MPWLVIIPVVWLLGVGFYYVTIYDPIVSLFRGVEAKVQTIKQVKRRHAKQAWLWPFYIHRIPSLLKEASYATQAQKKRK